MLLSLLIAVIIGEVVHKLGHRLKIMVGRTTTDVMWLSRYACTCMLDLTESQLTVTVADQLLRLFSRLIIINKLVGSR